MNSAIAPELTRLIYIGGGERTGTTLLQRILCTDPDYVPVVGEAHIFGDIVRIYTSAKSRFDFYYSDYFAGIDTLKTSLQQTFIKLISEIHYKHKGYNALALKAPAFTPVLPEMLEFTPHARAVIMLRNPWDAVASLCNVGKRAGSDSLAKVNSLADDPVKASERFVALYNRMMSEPVHPNIHLLKYENLVKQPAEVIRFLSSQFKGSFTMPEETDRSLDSVYLAADRDSKHSGYWSDNYRKRIVTTSVNTHKHQFSKQQLEQISEVTAEYIQWAGYGNYLS